PFSLTQSRFNNSLREAFKLLHLKSVSSMISKSVFLLTNGVIKNASARFENVIFFLFFKRKFLKSLLDVVESILISESRKIEFSLTNLLATSDSLVLII